MNSSFCSDILVHMEDKTKFPDLLCSEFAPLKHLGAGAFGSVWSVKKLSDQKKYAIKLFKKELTSDPVLLKRFQREKDLAGRQLHRGVVGIYDTGEVDGGLYLVMELIEGRSLAELLERSRPLDVVDSLQICLELADCLAALHEAGFVHRDIKPDNIYIQPNGRPKLLDLGLARDLCGDKLTKSGIIIGSPFYMSPALCCGEKARPCDDVFALGMSLLQCISSNNPATAVESMVELVAQRTGPNWRVSVPVATSGSVTNLLRKLTAADPKNRPANGREAVKAISESMSRLSSSSGFEATIKGEGKTKAVERTQVKKPKKVAKLAHKARPSKFRFVFVLVFLLISAVIGFQYLFYRSAVKTTVVSAKQTKVPTKEQVNRGGWPGLELLDKIAEQTENAKNAKTDWDLKDAAEDGLRTLKKLARLKWSPEELSPEQMGKLVLLPRVFLVHIAKKEADQKNLTGLIKNGKMPTADANERAVSILWFSRMFHDERVGVPPLMAKWYSKGIGLYSSVVDSEKKTYLGYSFLILREMCIYFTFNKRERSSGQEYLQNSLDTYKQIASELRELSETGCKWAKMMLLVTLYDQAAVISLKETHRINDKANKELDRIAMEAETLVPQWDGKGAMPLAMKLAMYCRDMAVKRPFNESAFPQALRRENMMYKQAEYQQDAFGMAWAHMNRYDKPEYVRFVHMQYFLAEWVKEEHLAAIEKRFGSTVKEAYKWGIIKELPSRLK